MKLSYMGQTHICIILKWLWFILHFCGCECIPMMTMKGELIIFFTFIQNNVLFSNSFWTENMNCVFLINSRLKETQILFWFSTMRCFHFLNLCAVQIWCGLCSTLISMYLFAEKNVDRLIWSFQKYIMRTTEIPCE